VTLLLAGDIGGTKSILSLYRHSSTGLQRLSEMRYPSAAWPDLAPMVQAFLQTQEAEGLGRPEVACFAVAGPVRNGQVTLTMLHWQLEEHRLAQDCGLTRVELVNDFEVLIDALPHLQPAQVTPVRAGEAVETAPRLVVGAGTGLGVAMGVPTANGLLGMATEAGHGTFAPRTEAEWRMSQWLKADLGVERLSIERVVSGMGLGAIARWLLAERHPVGPRPPWAADRAEDAQDWPEAVAAAAQAGDSLAQEALHLWLGAYGSVVGDLALGSLSRGGIWLAGGTAAKQIEGLRSPAFLDPLLAKGRLRAVLEPIPIQAITDPAVGVFGAACRAGLRLA
jgi:glucokinase